ncbi:BgTH12-03027 [Blumeria graminis f. sp. triticale]|uniref:BgTH12-03027 n=1 Tax=Blumeria graminis f. sp. triticale TaxID=1689686 RepID=A0A9W4GFZ7_BLUGR|nr:BgTH12-03027 [Blumeria graminis f. sp. triticale]
MRGFLTRLTRFSTHTNRHVSSTPAPLPRSQAAASSSKSAMAIDTAPSAQSISDYTSWTHEQLVARVERLEIELASRPDKPCPDSPGPGRFKKVTRLPRAFDPSKYSTRLVAFKLAYLGKRYNGFEFHANNTTPLPTVEEELWKAFKTARLIFPSKGQAVGDWEGCEYSKCGRTDKGVSAFGQVIGVRVRSNRPLGRNRGHLGTKVASFADAPMVEFTQQDSMQARDEASESFNTWPRPNAVELVSQPLRPSQTAPAPDEPEPDDEHDLNFDPIADELPYAVMLNRLLPPDIRILAWCPAPPLGFSARFSCRERQYRYFFTQPAFSPIPCHLDPCFAPSSNARDGFLDIEAMRAAAKLYEGLHDFRNLCKVDASKQIENFERRIFHADIEEVSDATSVLAFLNSPNFYPSTLPSQQPGFPKLYSFTLHGSAFLWHQVRHMVAILFLVGQGLEKASIVSELLDVARNPRRPMYEMAAETPLVLWDCIFAHEDDSSRTDALQWVYLGDLCGTGDSKFGVPAGGLVDDLWRVWRERKIDEVLAANLLGLVVRQGVSVDRLTARQNGRGRSQRVFQGGDAPRLHGCYRPVMQKPLMDSVDVTNERYALRKGFESAADLKQQGFRRLNKPGPDHDHTT